MEQDNGELFELYARWWQHVIILEVFSFPYHLLLQKDGEVQKKIFSQIFEITLEASNGMKTKSPIFFYILNNQAILMKTYNYIFLSPSLCPDDIKWMKSRFQWHVDHTNPLSTHKLRKSPLCFTDNSRREKFFYLATHEMNIFAASSVLFILPFIEEV